MASGRCLLAQNTDLMRLEYTYIPQSDSENVFARTRAFINFPIPLDWEGSYLIPGLEFRSVNLDLNGELPFQTAQLNLYTSYRATMAYTCKFKSDWRLGVKIGAELASNFERTDFLSDDLRFSGAVFMIKDNSGDEVAKPNRWIIGLEYSTNAGRPFPIPIINYYREFAPKWSYSLGTPKTNIKHRFAKNQSLQAFISIDGFFANVQNNVTFDSNGSTVTANNISMTSAFSALGYEYYFSEQLLFYAYGGYTFFNEIRLRDNSRNNLFTFNNNNTVYFRTGIKFKI
ncbi:MAG: DUF6268 family outer membrane beta-barrel protein [Gilvibacter sp.]